MGSAVPCIGKTRPLGAEAAEGLRRGFVRAARLPKNFFSRDSRSDRLQRTLLVYRQSATWV